MNAPNQLSFLPDDYLRNKAQKRTNLICAVLALVVMGGVASAFTLAHRSMRRLEAEHRAVDKQYTEAARRIEQVRDMQEKQRRMAQQAELTASLLEKIPRSYLLAEITNAMPAGVSLLDLAMKSSVHKETPSPTAKPGNNYEKKKADLAARKQQAMEANKPREYDVTIKITGVAQTDVHVAQFLSRLSRSYLLKDVNLMISDQYEQDDRQLRKFQIEMALNSDAVVTPEMREQTHTAAVELSEQ